MAHFNTVIAEHPDWELAGIYADEGISGTQVKNRVQFQQMIEDAKAKKIDLSWATWTPCATGVTLRIMSSACG